MIGELARLPRERIVSSYDNCLLYIIKLGALLERVEPMKHRGVWVHRIAPIEVADKQLTVVEGVQAATLVTSSHIKE